MASLLPESLDFLRELELNNNREWFEANKKRYEKCAKAPMTAIATECIREMQKIQPEITMDAKQAMFRLHRDTRFSKDKTPYKTHLSFAISKDGKGHHGTPGLYFHVGPREMGVASGCYMLEPDKLQLMRKHLAANAGELEERLNAPEFKKYFGEIQGEKNKILPPEFKEAAAKVPLIFNKQFYYWKAYDSEEALRDDLVPFLMEHFRAAHPMNEFLTRAFA